MLVALAFVLAGCVAPHPWRLPAELVSCYYEGRDPEALRPPKVAEEPSRLLGLDVTDYGSAFWFQRGGGVGDDSRC